MGWQNSKMPWRELEAQLSDRARPPAPARPEGADGGDSPAWSRKREPYVPPSTAIGRRPAAAPYAELHCHSSFSFLDGASDPERLVEESARLGHEALAITDHNGFYGVVRFAEAARAVGLPTVFGSELTVDKLDISQAQPDPDGTHLLVLARDPKGYAALARVISEAQLAGEKGAPRFSMSSLDRWLEPGEEQHWLVLTGCRKGAVPRALEREGPAAAARALDSLIGRFGRSNVAVELWDHGSPLDSVRNDALVELAMRAGVDIIATNNVHYATPADRRLATAMAAVRARRSLNEMDGWLPATSSAHLRSGDEQLRRFVRYPGVVERAAELGRECAFDLALVAPRLPPFPCPDGLSEMGFLRRLVEEAAVHRYGTRDNEYVPGAWNQLDRELDLIEHLGFPGYFLVVWDIVDFCRRNDIYCQGRGSAANSAVCYVLGITKADAVSLGLLFERFLSPERDGPPDIDLDIESDRREEAIQYVYERHGRRHAAQVANVITYRAKSAIRDAAKALGYATGQQDAFSKATDRWSGLKKQTSRQQQPGQRQQDALDLPADVLELAQQFEDLPRHLGIHSGGMVMCDRPVIEVCPVERARMENRTVLQWDKDDCAAAGLVKFDLLGLGMLSALHYAVDLITEHHIPDYGEPVDLAAIPQEEAVYDMLCRADSVGVFQVESRAQMSTLPRLKPRNFYDLVVEVALIRPGPIQGGSVHPYIRRRNGEEPVTYLHPLLEGALEKTLGIPLFQEQLMQMAIDVAGFAPGEADELRQAMGSKRSRARMERLRQRFFAGMAERGVTLDIGEQIWNKLAAFANYGFPESHSISFAYLVYASSWLKLHYPAAFCAALLRAQPMGFYSPHSLVQDARRHGVPTLTPDINISLDHASLERIADGVAEPEITSPGASSIAAERLDHGWAVRLGIGSVRHIGEELAATIVAGQPYASIEDVARRTGANREQLEALASAGAFDSLGSKKQQGSGQQGSGEQVSGQQGSSRRQALWTAGAVAQATGRGRLEGIVTGTHAPQLPGMGDKEEALIDLWATGVAPDGHPTRFLRAELDRKGVVRACDLANCDDASKVWIAGVVTHRQRPATASGTTFIGLEDESGLINVVVSLGCWTRFGRVARNAPALLIRGRVQRQGAVVNIVAERIEPLPITNEVEGRVDQNATELRDATASMSRDFR
ncbi:MAG: error-prone DNA polymerase [Acidimicrobiales bacterium]